MTHDEAEAENIGPNLEDSISEAYQDDLFQTDIGSNPHLLPCRKGDSLEADIESRVTDEDLQPTRVTDGDLQPIRDTLDAFRLHR